MAVSLQRAIEGSWAEITIILFLLLGALLFAGVPIFIALAGCVLIIFAATASVPLETIIMRMFAGLDKFALMSIPFFILAANLMSAGGISSRVINLAKVLVGGFRGGFAMTAVLACMFFGAISGSSPATVVAIGGLMYGALLKEGYDEKFSTGLLTAAGSLGVIIPPSILMIVYGAVTGASVGALFMSGFGAGAIYGLVFIVYSWYYARRHPAITVYAHPTFRELWIATREAGWGIGVPFIILGGIYGGVFTPTEAAAVAVVYSLLVAVFIYREIDMKDLWSVLKSSAITTAQVMIVLASASVFAWILTSEGITLAVAESLLSFSKNSYVILLMINIAVLIAGMFIDGASIIMILAPLFYPIAMKAGIDPIHLGIVLTVNCAIGMFTPPFGLNLFVATGVTNQPLSGVTRGILPFILISLVALLVVTYIPAVSLWLPRMIYGKW